MNIIRHSVTLLLQFLSSKFKLFKTSSCEVESILLFSRIELGYRALRLLACGHGRQRTSHGHTEKITNQIQCSEKRTESWLYQLAFRFRCNLHVSSALPLRALQLRAFPFRLHRRSPPCNPPPQSLTLPITNQHNQLSMLSLICLKCAKKCDVRQQHRLFKTLSHVS
jgi:hypothetical protein